MHLDLNESVSFAGLAASSFDIERKPSRTVALHLGICSRSEHITDHIEKSDISRRVGTRRSSNGRLVNADAFIHSVKSVNSFILSRDVVRPVQSHIQCFENNVIQKGRFPGSRYSGQTYQFA